MKETESERQPAGVESPKQAGEACSRCEWVERSVWTERMLAALETGVKGGKWFSLIDKVCNPANIEAAWEKVRQNKGSRGVDGETINSFESQRERNLTRLSEEIRTGKYEPRPVKRVYIPKPGKQEKRPLGIPAIRDRVVQTALRNVLEPIFEKEYAPHSYGFRPGLGCKDALRRVQNLLNSGYTYVVDADIQQYFDTIPHERLMEKIKEKVADGRVLGLIHKYLKADVMDGMSTWEPERGTPQGAVISPMLANIYLHSVDIGMMEAGYEMVRYADDFVVLCRNEEEARRALERVTKHIEELGLRLHPEKTRTVDATQKGGFDFLGYHFERGYQWPRKKSLDKLKDAIRAKTKRANGNSLPAVIDSVNLTLRGWFEYFKHSHKTTFKPIDGWVRMRLRSILRKRMGKRGRGRGSDHQRWPNSFFQELGLFTMLEAHALLCQSLGRVR